MKLLNFYTENEEYDEEEELEEGTFEDYEFGTDELPSNSKVFKKPILSSPAKNDTARKDKENISNSQKQQFESPSSSSKGHKTSSYKHKTEAGSSSIKNSTEKSLGSHDYNEETTPSNVEVKYDKYSVKNKVSSQVANQCKLLRSYIF